MQMESPAPGEMMGDIRLKRIYDPVSPDDGARVLVDRLWPRGMSKERAALDLWLPDIGPSHELRRWFGHNSGRWETFETRYRAELAQKDALLQRLREFGREQRLTLLFGARNREQNQAMVIKSVLEGRADRR